MRGAVKKRLARSEPSSSMDGEAHAFDSLTDRRSVEVLPNSLTLERMKPRDDTALAPAPGGHLADFAHFRDDNACESSAELARRTTPENHHL